MRLAIISGLRICWRLLLKKWSDCLSFGNNSDKSSTFQKNEIKLGFFKQNLLIQYCRKYHLGVNSQKKGKSQIHSDFDYSFFELQKHRKKLHWKSIAFNTAVKDDTPIK